jgi:ppGpp synthetase/RelA/SpoT-type nucleotidyltranferase
MGNNIIGLKNILKNIQDDIQSEIDRIGIHCRLYSRVKEIDSLQEKITRKGEGYYSKEGKKVQDICGFRITTYFIEDVKVLWDIFTQKYEKVDASNDQITRDNLAIFRPVHTNLVCRMADEDSKTLKELVETNEEYLFIDNTFELQFRTTLSEGWHEIDHALRYKCQSDWDDFIEESRMLNGIYATLETSEKALKSLFEDLSYQHYKKRNWEAMLRTKFRLKFTKKPLDKKLGEILYSNNELAKNIVRTDRKIIIERIALSGWHMPISFDNLVYLLNFLELGSEEIKTLQPERITEEIHLRLGNI